MEANAIGTTSGSSEQFDLRFIVCSIRSKWRWVVASTVMFLALFSAAAFLMTPVYRVTTTVVAVASERELGIGAVLGQLGGLASIAGIDIGSNDLATQEALVVLRSQEFIRQFIVDNELLPVFFADDWDADASQWKTDVADVPTLARGVEYFLDEVFSVSQDKKTGLISITIDWRDRDEAARWTTSLVERVNEVMRSRALERADQSIKFLEKELEQARLVESHDAITRLLDSQIRQRMVANVNSDFAFRVVDRGLPPDEDDPVRPKKLLMLVFGPLFGAAFGVLLVVFWQLLRPAFAKPTADPAPVGADRMTR